MNKPAKIGDLLGKTIYRINDFHEGSEKLTFHVHGGEKYAMYHEQDCCECVRLHEIHGALDDLLDAPILQAEEVSSQDDSPSSDAESHTWTFYKLATVRGSVTLRWLGESNGYYSEGVDFAQIAEAKSHD